MASTASEWLWEEWTAHDESGLGGVHSRRKLLGTTVAGVGIGIFIFFFFLAFCLLLCLAGSRTKSPGWIYTLSTLIFGIVFLVLFASPKGTVTTPESGYDQTIIPMTVIMVLLCLGIVVGGLGLLFFLVFPTQYARPLRYDGDVIGKD